MTPRYSLDRPEFIYEHQLFMIQNTGSSERPRIKRIYEHKTMIKTCLGSQSTWGTPSERRGGAKHSPPGGTHDKYGENHQKS